MRIIEITCAPTEILPVLLHRLAVKDAGDRIESLFDLKTLNECLIFLSPFPAKGTTWQSNERLRWAL